MTNGTAAALMLADDILGRDNPGAETFRSTRIHPGAGGMQIVKENVQVAAHFIKDHTVGNAEGSLEQLAPGEGGIVTAEGKEIAAYRDLAGMIHALSPEIGRAHV